MAKHSEMNTATEKPPKKQQRKEPRQGPAPPCGLQRDDFKGLERWQE